MSPAPGGASRPVARVPLPLGRRTPDPWRAPGMRVAAAPAVGGEPRAPHPIEQRVRTGDGFGAAIRAASDRGDITAEQASLVVRSL